MKKAGLSGTRPKDSGGGACRRLPRKLDAAFGEKLRGRVACLCVGPRGALAEAHPVLLIAHGPAEQPLTALIGEARGLLPELDQDVEALQGNPPVARRVTSVPAPGPCTSQGEGFQACPARTRYGMGVKHLYQPAGGVCK